MLVAQITTCTNRWTGMGKSHPEAEPETVTIREGENLELKRLGAPAYHLQITHITPDSAQFQPIGVAPVPVYEPAGVDFANPNTPNIIQVGQQLMVSTPDTETGLLWQMVLDAVVQQ